MLLNGHMFLLSSANSWKWGQWVSLICAISNTHFPHWSLYFSVDAWITWFSYHCHRSINFSASVSNRTILQAQLLYICQIKGLARKSARKRHQGPNKEVSEWRWCRSDNLVTKQAISLLKWYSVRPWKDSLPEKTPTDSIDSCLSRIWGNKIAVVNHVKLLYNVDFFVILELSMNVFNR